MPPVSSMLTPHGGKCGSAGACVPRGAARGPTAVSRRSRTGKRGWGGVQCRYRNRQVAHAKPTAPSCSATTRGFGSSRPVLLVVLRAGGALALAPPGPWVQTGSNPRMALVRRPTVILARNEGVIVAMTENGRNAARNKGRPY